MQMDRYDFSTCFLSLSLHSSVRARVHASDVNYPCAWSQVMLIDFGLAKQFDENTRSNSTCGTLEYMSSETVLAKGHDKATEWWSVGILLYEMLTGKVSMHLLARAPMLLVVT